MFGLFSKKEKNPKEKHSLIDVIRYEGPRDVFIWKHDCENFNTNSQLIVDQSQLAVFYKNGQALDIFKADRYTLTTQNIPLLRNLVGLATGGVTPFQCSVYFINLSVFMKNEWGTDTAINLLDPVHEVPIKLRGYGSFGLNVENPRKLIEKLVGTGKSFTAADVQDQFCSLLNANIRTGIAKAMTENGISALGIDQHLLEMGDIVEGLLIPMFKDYGLNVDHFSIAGLSVEGLEDVHERMRRRKVRRMDAEDEIEIEQMRVDSEVQTTLKKGNAQNSVFLQRGQAEAQVNQAKGISEQERLSYDIIKEQAKNPGTTVVNQQIPPLGFGMGGMTTQTFQNQPSAATESLKVVFGKPEAPVKKMSQQEFMDSVARVKAMRDADMMTEEEYKAEVAKLKAQI